MSGRLIGEDLRWVFISFLFAFAVSAIAEKYGKLFAEPVPACDRVRPFMDLAVASFLIASSWIGWSIAIEEGCCGEMSRVFEWPTAELFIDICLVILYYILVAGVRLPENNSAPHPDPSRLPFWVMVIFFGYVVWDLVVYVIISYPTIEFDRYGIITVICAAISALTWVAVRRFRLENQIITDCWLLALLVFFRYGKSVVSSSRVSTLLSWAMLVLVLIGCVIAIWADRRHHSLPT